MSTCITSSLTCRRDSLAPGQERVEAIGEIDLATGSRLTEALRAAQAHEQSVVLDLSGATFIDAGGARILLAADRRARVKDATFAIAHLTAPVERLLRLVGADRVLVILRPDVLPAPAATPNRSAVDVSPLRARDACDGTRSAAVGSG